jgi:hypothetical protein
MTTPITPIYGMPLPSDDSALADLALQLRAQSNAIEAALRRGGIAPPTAQDLATLAGRVTVNENKIGQLTTDLATPASTIPLPLNNGCAQPPTQFEPATCYKTKSGVVFCQGIFTSPAAGLTTGKEICTFPAGYLPSIRGTAALSFMVPTSTTGAANSLRQVDLQPDGRLVPTGGVAATTGAVYWFVGSAIKFSAQLSR